MSARDTKRKLTAILAADVVGYSRLMGQDDEGTLRDLTQCRAIFSAQVSRQRGRIVSTQGDAVLAEFPSVLDAVNSAVAMQKALAERVADQPEESRMLFRIGVNLGDVLDKGDDIFGDGVNIAARLESLADPGGICISGSVHDQVASRLPLEFEDLGPQKVKNITQPVRVFRILPEEPDAPKKPAKARPSTRQPPAPPPSLEAKAQAVVTVLYYLTSAFFFVYLFRYYITTAGGEVLLAFVLVPVTFIIHTLDSLRKNDFYFDFKNFKPPLLVNYILATGFIILCIVISTYMYVEFEAIGTDRAMFWNTTDYWLGGLMAGLVMIFAFKRFFELFIFNIILVLYAVYGSWVPGLFRHPGLDWERIVSMMSLEDTTGVYSDLPQLALTLIGSFVLVLAVLRAFGCIDSILKASSRIANKSPYALPQTAVIGSFGVAAVSGSGAANAVTTGSATIPAMIDAGLPREDAAAVETASSLGGQLMPPIMGLSAFLMAEFMEVSYFDVVARGYAPAIIYFIGVALGVYLLSVRKHTHRVKLDIQSLIWADWFNISAFFMVVIGLILFMAVAFLPPMFAARYVFYAIGTMMLLKTIVLALQKYGRSGLVEVGRTLLRFLDNFTSMTADLTLLLATLSILTSAFVNTGVVPKVGYLLIEVSSANLTLMVLVAFLFGALLGMGLPPAPTYILTALVIAPHLQKAGLDPWPVHFFAFFLAVWGELTPPTSVVAAVTSKIARASFLGTLWRAIILCSSLFVLMAAVFSRPGLVLEPGLTQFAMMMLILMTTIGFTFAFQARFSPRLEVDIPLRLMLAGFSSLALFHPDLWVAFASCVPIALMAIYWVKYRKQFEEKRALAASPAG